MKEYRKHPAGRPAPAEQARPADPLAGGMPSLTEGASRKDLPEAMRAKMEHAFGADFSNLNIYESEKVAEGGARAVTQGNTIAFAPGEFNLYSPSGEALLGHELSHVVSQARGESRGNGLLTDSYLEAKADREGVMAAAGQQVYSGPLTPLSASSPMSVAGPMQCKRKSEKDKTQAEVVQEGFAEKGRNPEEKVNMLMGMQSYLQNVKEGDKGYDPELAKAYFGQIQKTMTGKMDSAFLAAFSKQRKNTAQSLVTAYQMNNPAYQSQWQGNQFRTTDEAYLSPDEVAPTQENTDAYLQARMFGGGRQYANFRAMEELERHILRNDQNRSGYRTENSKIPNFSKSTSNAMFLTGLLDKPTAEQNPIVDKVLSEQAMKFQTPMTRKHAEYLKKKKR